MDEGVGGRFIRAVRVDTDYTGGWIASPIVMLTVYDDSERLFQALRAGACGYMLKRTPPEKLIEAIEEAAGGGAPMSRQIARQVVQYFNPTKPSSDLTPREQEVLELLTRGHQYKEIADHLGVSINTIRTYIRRIYEKLHVSCRSHATLKYLKSSGPDARG